MTTPAGRVPLPACRQVELAELDLERLQTAWQVAVFALYLAEFTRPGVPGTPFRRRART